MNQTQINERMAELQEQIKTLKIQERSRAKSIKQATQDRLAMENANRVQAIHELPDNMAVSDLSYAAHKLGIRTVKELFTLIRSRPRNSPNPVSEIDRMKVVAWVRANPNYSSGSIAVKTGVDRTVPSLLVKSGHLKATGKGRGTRYTVAE